MKDFTADFVKQAFFSSVNELQEHPELFFSNPASDFTRRKKISFLQTILFPMVAGSDNLDSEILDFFGEDNLVFSSAMVQRRNQVKPEAFQALFYSFLKKMPVLKNFLGYRILAVDGTRINLPYNPSDPDTFVQCIEGRRGINQVHLNCISDVLNDCFLDVELQGIHHLDEQAAFVRFLDRISTDTSKKIFLADRGYASYNVFAHAVHNNQYFLIRVPESFAKSICTNCTNWLTSVFCDKEVTVHIGRRNTKKHNALENYHFIPSSRRYDYSAPRTNDTDCFNLRVLKFPLSEDSYEYIVTNLPAYSFSLTAIKKLYHMRWGIETAFRHLKYAGNMVHIHSLKKNFLIQEIYAKLIMYNFSSFIIASVDTTPTVTDKHTYVLNHTQAIKTCIRFLRGKIKELADMLRRYVVPVRPGRNFERNLRRQSADTLQYR